MVLSLNNEVKIIVFLFFFKSLLNKTESWKCYEGLEEKARLRIW